MSVGGREQLRTRNLRWAVAIAGVNALLALLFLTSGHWVVGLFFGVIAAVVVFLFVQLRTVR